MSLILQNASKDDPFLYEVFAAHKKEEMAWWGWDEVQMRSFTEMQYRMREQSYRMQYPEMEVSLILKDGEKAGCLMTALTEEARVIVDMTLLPSFRRQGIGTSLLRRLQRLAEGERVPLRLSVRRENPARMLYERLGFRRLDADAVYLRMEWKGGEGVRCVSFEDFTKHRNDVFSVRLKAQAQVTVDLRLAEAEDKGTDEKNERFSLLFQGPNEPYLPQKLYRLSHDTLGEMDLFLVPVGRNEDGLTYEAVFNRFRNESNVKSEANP